MQEFTELSAEEAVAVGGVIGSMLSTILIVSVVFTIIMIVARWRLFTKAGEPGWKSIIPIYSDYMVYKLVWDAKNFWIFLGLTVGSSILMGMSGSFAISSSGVVAANSGNTFLAIIGGVLALAACVMGVIVTVKTAHAYGKGTGFGVGLVLLYDIFILILAFGSAEYVGPNGNPQYNDPRA